MTNSISTHLRTALIVAGLLLVAVAVYGQPAPPGVNPTHYWTYRLIDPVFQPATVKVKDQFLPQGADLNLDSLTRLVNWVSKNGSPVQPDTFIHYTWWNAKKIPTSRTVFVTNQFGQYTVSVFNTEFMLVPAWKNQPQPGQPLANHYLCYKASGFPSPGISYHLVDEWTTNQLVPLPLEYLCNPCLKEHGGFVYPPVDTFTHLAVYPIKPQSERFDPFISDQFFTGVRAVGQLPNEYLFVPSRKDEEPTPARRSTWGNIKTLYR